MSENKELVVAEPPLEIEYFVLEDGLVMLDNTIDVFDTIFNGRKCMYCQTMLVDAIRPHWQFSHRSVCLECNTSFMFPLPGYIDVWKKVLPSVFLVAHHDLFFANDANDADNGNDAHLEDIENDADMLLEQGPLPSIQN